VRRLAYFIAIYLFVLLAVSIGSQQKTAEPGEPRCFDEWCITVIGASRQTAIDSVKASGEFRVVTVNISSRSRGRRQREEDVYTYPTDSKGKRFEISSAGQQELMRTGLAGEPVTSYLEPGGSFESRLAFDVPEGVTDLGFVKTSHSWFPLRLIIGDPSSFLHRPVIVRLQ